tara:strand:- start:510 stop:1028 length:519 start_codon:yes stop_codon:yes gene_type:complete
MNLHTYILIIVVFLFISCNDDEIGSSIGTVNPLETQANILKGTWKLDQITGRNSIKELDPVTKDGVLVDIFKSMTLTISEASAGGGSYSTLNTYDEEIWPSLGTWTFQNNDKNKILRSDNVSISILVEVIHNYAQPKVYTLRTSFTTASGNKDIKWVFNFNRECSSPFNQGC